MTDFSRTMQDYNTPELSDEALHDRNNDFTTLPNATHSSICNHRDTKKENAPPLRTLRAKIEGAKNSQTSSLIFGELSKTGKRSLTMTDDLNLSKEDHGKQSCKDERNENKRPFESPIVRLQKNLGKKNGQSIGESQKEKWNVTSKDSLRKSMATSLRNEQDDSIGKLHWHLHAKKQNNGSYPSKPPSSCCKNFHQKKINDPKLEDRRFRSHQEGSLSQILKVQSPHISESVSLTSIKEGNLNFKVNSELLKQYNLRDDDLVRVEKLGKGAFGEVYRLFSKTSGAFFALKKLIKKDDQFDVSAKQESEALLILLDSKNPKLLQVIQLYYEPKVEFSALMEYGQGTLDDFSDFLGIKKHRWQDKDLLNLYYQLYEQLRALRYHSLCHRDIKPANIIITNEGSFKLTDYGLAEILDMKGPQRMRVAGTESYWALEIDEAYKCGESHCFVDPFQADLFSLDRTLDYLMAENGRTDGISDLLNKYPNYNHVFQAGNQRVELYEEYKTEYRMYHFEKLYQHFSLQEKYKKLRIFLEYYNFDEVEKWLDTKLKDSKSQSEDEIEEIQLVYFLKAEIYHLKGNYQKARKFFTKSEKVHLQSGKEEGEFIAYLYSAKGNTEIETCNFDLAEQYFLKG